METGVNSFTAPAELGALYPFLGTEVLLVILGLALWIGWHVLDVRGEGKEFEEAARLYREVGLERIMHNNGSARILSEEELVVEKVNKLIHDEYQHKVLGNESRKPEQEESSEEARHD
jgi:hypothetical protein